MTTSENGPFISTACFNWSNNVHTFIATYSPFLSYVHSALGYLKSVPSEIVEDEERPVRVPMEMSVREEVFPMGNRLVNRQGKVECVRELRGSQESIASIAWPARDRLTFDRPLGSSNLHMPGAAFAASDDRN